MTRHLLALSLCLSAVAYSQETPPAVEPAILQSAETAYSNEAAKADAIIAKAEAEAAKVRKAAGEARLKTYKERLAEVTKAGDFDKAIAVKARIEQLGKGTRERAQQAAQAAST